MIFQGWFKMQLTNFFLYYCLFSSLLFRAWTDPGGCAKMWHHGVYKWMITTISCYQSNCPGNSWQHPNFINKETGLWSKYKPNDALGWKSIQTSNNNINLFHLDSVFVLYNFSLLLVCFANFGIFPIFLWQNRESIGDVTSRFRHWYVRIMEYNRER